MNITSGSGPRRAPAAADTIIKGLLRNFTVVSTPLLLGGEDPGGAEHFILPLPPPSPRGERVAIFSVAPSAEPKMVPTNSEFRIPNSAIKNGVLIGTSGYNYPHWWNGTFYPSDLPQKRWLEFYAEYFKTVELNVSFYRLPRKEVFQGWYKRTPKEFVFTLKGSRFITHLKQLKDCREPVSLFFDHASPLKEKLGAVLWQLPPRFKFQKERLEEFCVLLTTLPRSKHHRHAFEFRDESWFCPEAFRVLEDFHFTFCMAHGSGLPFIKRATSDFIYVRLHGGEVLYGSNYSDRELKQWAGKIQAWRKKDKTAFVYFNNDAYGFAVKNALALKKWMFQDRMIP